MTAPRKVGRYGWRKDSLDYRDLLYFEHFEALDTARLPPAVDLSPKMPPIWDQGQLGSCTAHGIVRCLAYQAMRQGEPLAVSATNAGYSRLAVYYGEREIEGTVGQDAGAEIRDGIKTIASDGAPLESLWPYSDANPGPFQQKPPASAYANAAGHKALAYYRIIPQISYSRAPIRSALAAGHPIVFGFSVPASFEDGSWNPAAEPLPLPRPGEPIIGGHCVVLTGYDFSRYEPVLIAQNSWGAEWGKNGTFEMTYHWFDKSRGLADDLWVILTEE